LPWVNDTPKARMLSRVGAAEAALYKHDEPGHPEDPEPPVDVIERIVSIVKSPAFRGAMILAILFFANAVMSWLKDRALGHVFGGGPEFDAFVSASKPAQVVLEFLVLAGVMGPFLPIFLSLKDEAESASRDFARTVFTASIAVLSLAMILVVALAPQLASVLVPGYSGIQLDEYVGMLRLMCFAQLIFAASLVLGEILVAERRFFAYGLADILYNAGIVGGAVVLSVPFGIYGAALGMIAGAATHLAWRLFAIYRVTSFRPALVLLPKTKGIGQYLVLMGPKMISQPLPTVLTGIYFGALMSSLAPGSTSSFSIALNFQSIAESVIGLAFATAAFPALSAAAAAGDKRGFRRIFFTNAASIGGLAMAAGLGLAVMSHFVISLFMRSGAYDETDVARTSMVLAILAFSIPIESLVELVARAIYATQNTTRPMLAAIAFFIAGVATTVVLQSPLGLAAIPIAYTVGRAVQLGMLVLLLQPRMARIGGASKWSRAIVRDRWGDARGREPLSAGRAAILATVLVALTAGTAFAATQVVTSANAPEITPWARVNGTRPPVIAYVTPAPTDSTGPNPTGPLPSATAPGIFVMDMYHPGDFVEEAKDTWCVPAAMQTSINIMSIQADTTRDTQARLFDLAVSIAGSSYGGADPDGWAAGLASLGYGRFKVDTRGSLAEAVKVVVKQIRMTTRPAGLLVWRGWHSWVVSGFTATADPAVTDNFTVLSLRIEDVWYPRLSGLWSKSRNGMSRPPDSDVKVSALAEDYLPWNQGAKIAGRQGMYVFVMPEV